MNSRILDYTALVVTVIGAVNWGLIGFFRFNLVTFLFGDMTWISRIIYALVGICGLYLLSLFGRVSSFFRRYRTSLKRRSPFVCAVKKKSCRFKPLILLKTTALSYLL